MDFMSLKVRMLRSCRRSCMLEQCGDRHSASTAVLSRWHQLVGCLQKKKDADKAAASSGKTRRTAGELRMQKGANMQIRVLRGLCMCWLHCASSKSSSACWEQKCVLPTCLTCLSCSSLRERCTPATALLLRADIAELHISDIGEFKQHTEGNLMDFDITVIPQGGLYKCA